MKAEFKAKIVGHELFTPDKDTPNREAVRVKLQIAPTGAGGATTALLGKPTKGVLTIEEKDLPKFPLRGYLSITVQDSQQTLDFQRTKTKTDDAQLDIDGRRGRGAKTEH